MMGDRPRDNDEGCTSAAHDPWTVIERIVIRVELPVAIVSMLLLTLISFWIGHDAYGLIFLCVTALLALVWAHFHGKK